MTMQEASRVVRACFCLSEGLDFPDRHKVLITPENRLLQNLATLPGMDPCWNVLTTWLESEESETERLNQLRRAYYDLFLSHNGDLYIHAHRWFPDESPGTFLGDLRGFMNQTEVDLNPAWRNGADHVSVMFETLAHVLGRESPDASSFLKRFILPWFPTFTTRLSERSGHDYYRAVSMIADEVHHEIEGLV